MARQRGRQVMVVLRVGLGLLAVAELAVAELAVADLVIGTRSVAAVDPARTRRAPIGG